MILRDGDQEIKGCLEEGKDMEPEIDYKKLVRTTDLVGENEKDTMLLKSMFLEASKFLKSFRWCEEIEESYFGLGVGGVVAVFLFKIIPSQKSVDEWLWVIVGDLPSAYIVIDDAPNAACALDSYIEEMSRWVKAVELSSPIDDLMPVNAPPTLEYANQLESRLGFLRKEILSGYEDDLKERV